jgi:hypothetical protein
MTRIYPVCEGAVLPPRIARVAVAQSDGFDVPDHVAAEMARFGFALAPPVLIMQGAIEATAIPAPPEPVAAVVEASAEVAPAPQEEPAAEAPVAPADHQQEAPARGKRHR